MSHAGIAIALVAAGAWIGMSRRPDARSSLGVAMVLGAAAVTIHALELLIQ